MRGGPSPAKVGDVRASKAVGDEVTGGALNGRFNRMLQAAGCAGMDSAENEE